MSERISKPESARPEATERRIERRMEGVMQNRHQTSLVALEMEDLLESHSKQRLTNVEMSRLDAQATKMIPTGIDKNVYDNFARGIFDTINTIKTTQDTEAVLAKAYVGSGGSKSISQFIGEDIFTRLTGADPKGIVEARRDGGFFIISCSDPEDYRYSVTREKDPKKSPADSSGVFERGFMLEVPGLGDVKIPVMMIRGTKQTEPEYEKIVTHERQHFLNSVALRYFVYLEPLVGLVGATPEALKLKTAYARAKDEILAFAREGSPALKTTRSLSGALYENIFTGLSEEDREAMHAMIGEVTNAMENTVLWQQAGERGRALLINNLVDIPLNRMAAWLPRMDQFYAKKIQTQDAYRPTPVHYEFFDRLPVNFEKEKRDEVLGYAKTMEKDYEHLVQLRLGVCGHDKCKKFPEAQTKELQSYIRNMQGRTDQLIAKIRYLGSDLITEPDMTTVSVGEPAVTILPPPTSAHKKPGLRGWMKAAILGFAGLTAAAPKVMDTVMKDESAETLDTKDEKIEFAPPTPIELKKDEEPTPKKKEAPKKVGKTSPVTRSSRTP